MALIKCPECGNACSNRAEYCPKCGYPFPKKTTSRAPVNAKPKQETYYTKVVEIKVWGSSAEKLQEKLHPYIKQGWEVVAMVEDPWRGSVLRHFYKVTIRRKV